MIATEPDSIKAEVTYTTSELLITSMTAIQAAAAEQLKKKAEFVVLVTRRREPPRGEHVNLCGKIGPRGQLRCCTRDGPDWRIVAAYDPRTVVQFCKLTIQELMK
jgi:hypothetical protein